MYEKMASPMGAKYPRPGRENMCESEGYSDLTTASRQSQVTEQLEAQEKATVHLSSVVDELQMRLCTVTRNTDEDAKNGVEPVEFLVPLADAIRNNTTRVYRAAQALQSLMSRLEL